MYGERKLLVHSLGFRVEGFCTFNTFRPEIVRGAGITSAPASSKQLACSRSGPEPSDCCTSNTRNAQPKSAAQSGRLLQVQKSLAQGFVGFSLRGQFCVVRVRYAAMRRDWSLPSAGADAMMSSLDAEAMHCQAAPKPAIVRCKADATPKTSPWFLPASIL